MRSIEHTASLNEIHSKGYSLQVDVLSESECEFYKQLLERDYAKWSPYYANSSSMTHGLNDKSHEKVVYNLHNKDVSYFDLFDHPRVFPIVESVLQLGSYQESEAVNLLNTSARCPQEGAPAQQLHLDSNLPGCGRFPLIVVALFMLDDFTTVNGATRVVPCSHTLDHYAEDGKSYDSEVIITAEKGSVLLYDAALWHGSSVKQDASSRWAVILGFGRWFIKPSFDFCRNTPVQIYERISDERKALLGLKSEPPVDEFTRITRRSESIEWEAGYEFPGKSK